MQEPVAIDADADDVVRVIGVIGRKRGVRDAPDVRGIRDIATGDRNVAIGIARSLIVVSDELILVDRC